MTRVRIGAWLRAAGLVLLAILNINLLEGGPGTTFFKVSAQQFHFNTGGGGGGRRRQQNFGGGGGQQRQKKPQGEDYYKLLGIKRDAPQKVIKKNFKKMAIKYHPDKNADDPEGAKVKFQKIANAYETLSDPEKREIYDVHGEEGVKENEQRQGGSHQDIFEQFFGGGGFHQQQGGGREEYEDIFQNSDVIKLNLQTVFQFYRRKEIWAVLFYDVSKEDSRALADEYKLLAEKMFGIIKVGAIDCRDEEELCEEFSVFEHPVIKIFTENANDDGEKFTGKKEWKSISNAAAKKMQSFVSVVNEGNYEQFVERDPQKNKVIVFTNRKSTAPLIKSMSKTYKEKLSFGEIKKEPNLNAKFGITEFPTLMVLTDPHNFKGEVYDMKEMKIDQLKKFLSTYAYAKTNKEKKAELIQLTAQKQSNPQGPCGRKNSNLCVILFVRGKGEALLEQYMPIVRSFINDPITFTYVHTDSELELSEQFGIQNDGAVIYKPKRGRYIQLKSALDPQQLKSFVDGAISGGAQDWIKLDNQLQLQNGKKDEL